MYEGSFGLKRRPFSAVPQIDHYVATTAIEAARTTLARCIQRGEGAGLVIGPSGTGKTLLCRMLAEQFQRNFHVVMLSSGRLSTRRALFQAILYELGQPFRGMDEGESRLAVIDYLMATDEGARGMALLVDEAHTLPLRLLEELRLLSNLVRGDQPSVRLTLAGGPVLEERFASPKLDSFSQRLSARCYLEALNRTETESYIQSQIQQAGGQGDQVFPSETCQCVFQATNGVPRLINQVCDHAMLLSYVAGRRRIETTDVEEAWSDLQQLPAPWTSGESKPEPAAGGVIEFGSLDDTTDSATETIAAETPSLRVTAIEEDHEAEPVQQIGRIEKLLAEADDDFQPAGSIGPEMEVRFDEPPIHPFQETFEQEEVVADRYAASVKPATLSVVPELPKEPEESKIFQGSEVFQEPKLLQTTAFFETSAVQDPSQPSDAPAVEETPSMEDELVSVLADVQNQESASAAATSPEPTPRPREYRHLFARLRRG